MFLAARRTNTNEINHDKNLANTMFQIEYVMNVFVHLRFNIRITSYCKSFTSIKIINLFVCIVNKRQRLEASELHCPKFRKAVILELGEKGRIQQRSSIVWGTKILADLERWENCNRTRNGSHPVRADGMD